MQNGYSWQDPEGRFHPVTADDYSHGSMAHSITGDTKDPIMMLWKRGWNRIAYMGDTLYCHNEASQPNQRQIKALTDLAMEVDVSKVVYDGGDKQRVLWSVHDTLQETTSGIEFISPDEADFNYYDELNRIERESGIRILRNKELNLLAVQGGKVLGALYTENDGEEFSFDVIVDKPARGQGIGAKLIDMALDQFRQEEIEMGTQLKVDVVNPWVEKYLLHKGLKVVQRDGGHTIMTK